MSKHLWLPAVFIGLFSLSPVVFAAHATWSWQNPAIKDAGAMVPLANGIFQPDKTTIYKAVFSVTHFDAKHPGDPDGGLEPVARAVNVFASAGVALSHLKFVVIIHGEATPIVANNASFKKEYHVDNPNLKVIQELEAAGVEVAVCGQAVASLNYGMGKDAKDYTWVDPDVKIALSALSTMIILQHDGYVLMPL
ncbi:MAG: DsrE family protein [Gammaproteobacteria bacterium]